MSGYDFNSNSCETDRLPTKILPSIAVALNQDNINPLHVALLSESVPHHLLFHQCKIFPVRDDVSVQTFLWTIGPAGQEPYQIMPGGE